MALPYLLLDIDGVLVPFPAADGSTPPTHVRHTVLPTGRHPDDPVPVWLDPSHGPLLTDLVASGLVTPVWCTSWRKDASTIIGPILGLPHFPYLDLLRPQITTSHPNGYLWKRDHVDAWLGTAPAIWIDDDFTPPPRPQLGRRTHRRRPPHPAHPARPLDRAQTEPHLRGQEMGLRAGRGTALNGGYEG